MMMSCFSSIASGMCWDSSKLNSWLKYACVVRINKYHKMNNQIVLNFKAVGCFQTTEKSKLNKLLSGKSVQFIFTCWPLFRLLFFPPHNIIVQSHKKGTQTSREDWRATILWKDPGIFIILLCELKSQLIRRIIYLELPFKRTFIRCSITWKRNKPARTEQHYNLFIWMATSICNYSRS